MVAVALVSSLQLPHHRILQEVLYDDMPSSFLQLQARPGRHPTLSAAAVSYQIFDYKTLLPKVATLLQTSSLVDPPSFLRRPASGRIYLRINQAE